jgi:hypothetical protein
LRHNQPPTRTTNLAAAAGAVGGITSALLGRVRPVALDTEAA